MAPLQANIFGDHGTRNISSYNYHTNEVEFIANIPSAGVGSKNGISSFGTDLDGNIFILKLYGTDLDGGKIYKILPAAPIADPPTLLSQTGAFTNLIALTPRSGMMPYTVNSPFGLMPPSRRDGSPFRITDRTTHHLKE
ncbi:MAG: hypothetical protein IPL46_05340 [Saprospiraceae bacterium]|nr:hypothetical protein [Saprospiraceae bacterium]